jgi:DNA-binding beta-propeller fold protein YncE
MPKQVQQFVGMNSDVSPQVMPPGDYIDACDVRVIITENGNDGFIETAKGNTSKFSELGFSLPTGTNLTRGRVNDTQNNRLIWLNYNSNGNHGIYCYNLDSNTIQTVMETSVFNLQPNIVIHSADILNNILGGTDGFNRPFSLDVNAALQGQYGNTIIQEMITDVKIPPALPPVCTPVPTTGANFIKSLYSFQFIYRYVFFGGEKSTFCSVSHQIPTGYVNEPIQYITLDVSGCELFTKTPLRAVIAYVEFAVRDIYTLNFYQFLRVTTDQLVTGAGLPASVWVAPGIINYYDTESKTAIDNADYLMSYSSVPLLANTMNYQDNRKFYAGTTEGYNAFPLVVGQNITGIAQFELPSVGGIPDVTDCDLHINQKYLKPDSAYGWGLIWMDNYGYKSAVQSVQGLSFTNAPYRGNDAKANGVQFTLPFSNIANYPPWATHFILVRTPNKTVEWEAQARANNILYCTGYNPSTGDPIYIIPDPGPGNSNLTDVDTVELHVDISNLTQYGINIPYVFEQGDKITFITTGGNGSTSASQLTTPGLNEKEAASSLAHLDIISQVGNILKLDYSQAYTLNLNAIANDPFGAIDDNDSGGSQFPPISMITVGTKGFMAIFGYVNDALYAYPSNSLTNTSPTINDLYGCAYSCRYNVTVGSNWFNIVAICGDNGEVWMNNLQGIFAGTDFNFATLVWTKITTGITTTLRCITYDADNFTRFGTHQFWAVGDNGVILQITNPTAGNTVPANFVVTSFTNAAFGRLNSIDASPSNGTFVCGDNGVIAFLFMGSFTALTGSPLTCNRLNSISVGRDGPDILFMCVGDAGTILTNVGGTSYASCTIVPSGTAANLYGVKQNVQIDAKTLTYKGINNQYSVVGEGNIFLNVNSTTSVITNLSSDVNLTTLGDSKGCTYQYTNVGSPRVNHNDIFVAGSKDTLYGILQTSSVGFIDLTKLTGSGGTPVGIILGNLALTNILNWGAKFEIYTPLQAGSADIYYEYGDVFPVGQDYTFFKGKEDDGDVFLIKKNFRGIANSIPWAVDGDVIFSMQPNANNTMGEGIATPGTNAVTGAAESTPIPWDLDFGRPNVILLYPEKQLFRNIVRYSDPYVQASSINGLSSFQQLNYEVIPANYGPVRKITAAEYVMVINCEKEVVTAYINRTIFNQSSTSPGVTALSDQVINNITVLRGGYGCKNPESVVEYMTNVSFYSQVKGMDCRYSNNGVYPISQNNLRTYFYKRNNGDLAYCSLYGGIDPKFGQRLLTYNYQFAYTQDTTKLIDAGFEPLVEVYVPLNQFAYILNFGDGTVTPLNTANDTTLPAITVGNNPQGAQFATSDNCLYIACAGSNAVYIIDPTTQATTGSPISTTGSSPQGLIYYNSALYVVNNSGVVDMIDLNPSSGTYRTVIHSSPALGSNIVSPTLNTDAGEIYVSNINSFSIQALSTTNVSLLHTIVLPSSSDAPRGTIYASPVKRLYVCNHGTAVSSVIDVQVGSGTRYTIVENITLPAAGSWLGVYLNNIVWIAGGLGNFLYGIDTTEGFGALVVTQPVGANPASLIIGPMNNYLFISSANDTVVTVYDSTNRVIVNNINVGFESRGLLASPSNNKVYAAIEGEGQVASIGGVITPVTITFTEGATAEKKRWGTRYSFIPEMYGWIKNDMFTFLNGELWQHNDNDVCANYYGVQYKPTITTVCNQDPNKVKILQHLQVASNNLWNATAITTPEGQLSQLIGLRDYTTSYAPPQDFELLEGMFCASVLRDFNSPNIPSGRLPLLSGDLMRSEYFEVTLECESTEFTILKYVNFYYIYSRATNK